MFFGKTRWAARIVDAAGIEPTGSLGCELVDLIVSLSKQIQQASRHTANVALKDPDAVITAALTAATDMRSIARLSDAAMRLSRAQAEETLAAVMAAADAVATRYGHERSIEVFKSRQAER